MIEIDGGADPMELTVCPVEDCENTEDLWMMECAPGYTWTFVNGCGHWGFIHRKIDA